MIKVPDGWVFPKYPIDWNKTNIDDVKIVIDTKGRWHFLIRT